MRYIFSFSFAILTFFAITKYVYANNDNQFVNIVNPVRISTYTLDPKETLLAQYKVIFENDLPATWLLTYEAFHNEAVLEALGTFEEDQEIGIFMEVGPELADASGVEYNDSGFWHHATSVFLSGYTQGERLKMIDTSFEAFISEFGYYPKSVGAWWIDSFSLSYMREKYGIIANLGVADQHSTDGYQVWGQYWSTPFYPSKNHAGIPGRTADTKIDVVTIQWAPRDPLNGYFSSLYSTQDYKVGPVNQETDYFEKLVNLYAKKHENEFGQITVGLESDLTPDAYEGEFRVQMEVVSRLRDEGVVTPATMQDFASWYRKTHPNSSPNHIIETDDLLGESVRIIWFQTQSYRIGISHNYETELTKIFDFRSYHSDFREPYFTSPNREFELSIYIPSYFDEVNYHENVWRLELGALLRSERVEGDYKMNFEEGEILLSEESLLISGAGLNVPKVLSESSVLNVDQVPEAVEITPQSGWIVGAQGHIFRDLTDVATHELVRKRTTTILLFGSLVFLLLSFLVIRSNFSEKAKVLLLSLLIIPPLIYSYIWYEKNSSTYYVSQAEIDALFRLSVLPPGDVLVYDKECLGCDWHTPEKPAVFANKRSYVEKWGKHPVIYNSSVFGAENQSIAKEEFEKTGAEYIYLAKYENYIEKAPFSPGDLGIEKIYDNANAEVWRVKN